MVFREDCGMGQGFQQLWSITTIILLTANVLLSLSAMLFSQGQNFAYYESNSGNTPYVVRTGWASVILESSVTGTVQTEQLSDASIILSALGLASFVLLGTSIGLGVLYILLSVCMGAGWHTACLAFPQGCSQLAVLGAYYIILVDYVKASTAIGVSGEQLTVYPARSMIASFICGFFWIIVGSLVLCIPPPGEQDHSQEKAKEVLFDPEAPPPQEKDSPTSVCITASAVPQDEPMPHASREAALDLDQQMCFSTARECPKVMPDSDTLHTARSIVTQSQRDARSSRPAVSIPVGLTEEGPTPHGHVDGAHPRQLSLAGISNCTLFHPDLTLSGSPSDWTPSQATGAATQMPSTASPFPKDGGFLCSRQEHLQAHSDAGGAVSLDPTLLPSPNGAQDNCPVTEHLHFTSDSAMWQILPPMDLEGGAVKGQAFPRQTGRSASNSARRSQPSTVLVGHSPPQSALARNRARSFSAVETLTDDFQPMLDAGLITVHALLPKELLDSEPTADVEEDRQTGASGGAVVGEGHGGPVGETDGHRAAWILGTQGTLPESDTSGGPPGCDSLGDPLPMGAEDLGADEKADQVQTEPQEGGWFQALARKLAAKADLEGTTPLEEPASQISDSLPGQHATDSSAIYLSYTGAALNMWEESVLTGSPEPKSLSSKALRSPSLGFDGTVNEHIADPDTGVYATRQDAPEGFGGLQDCHVVLAQSRSERHTLQEDRAADQHVQAHLPPGHCNGDPGLQHARHHGQRLPQCETGSTVNSTPMKVPDERLVQQRNTGSTSSCPSLMATHEQALMHGGAGQTHNRLSTGAFSEQLGLRDGIGQPANCLSSVSTLAVEFEDARSTVAATYTVLPEQLSSEHALGEFALGKHARHPVSLAEQEDGGQVDPDAAFAVLQSVDYEVTGVERVQGPAGEGTGMESRECSILGCAAVSTGLIAVQHGAHGKTEGSLGAQHSSSFTPSLRVDTVPMGSKLVKAPANVEAISLPTPDVVEAEHTLYGAVSNGPGDRPNRDLPHIPRPKPELQNPQGELGQRSRVSSPAGKTRYSYHSPSPISPQLDIGEVRESLRHVSPQSHKPVQLPREPRSPVTVEPVSVAARARAFNELVKRAAVNKSPDTKSVPITRSRTCLKQARPNDAETSKANSGPRSASCAPSAVSLGARYPPSVLAPLRKALQFDSVDGERRSQAPLHQQKTSSPTVLAGAGAALPDQEPHVDVTSSLSTQGARRMATPQEPVPQFSAGAWGASARHQPPPANVYPVQGTDSGPSHGRRVERRSEDARKPEAGWVAENAPAQPVSSSAGCALQPASGNAPEHRAPTEGITRQSEQPLLPSRIPRLSSTGSRSRGTSSEGERPSRDRDEPHEWEPSKLHHRHERMLYHMVVQAGPSRIPVTREEQAAVTDGFNLRERERLAPPVSSEAAETSGPPHKEGPSPSSTASHVPQSGVGRRLLTPTRLLYKMVVQAGCTSPSKVSGGTPQGASRHPGQSTTTADAAAASHARQAGVTAERLAAVACTQENEVEQVQLRPEGLHLAGTPASRVVEAEIARAHAGSMAGHSGLGGAQLKKGAMPLRFVQAKSEPTGTNPAISPSAVNIRDSGDWITISADQQHLRHFLDADASTDATPPISGPSTLTAVECRDAGGHTWEMDVGRHTIANPELHLQPYLDSSVSTNTTMLSTMYTTAAPGQPPQQVSEAGALPRADTGQGPQTRLLGELPASRAENAERTQRASRCPGNNPDVRPAVVGARAPKRPVQMPLQRTPPQDKQTNRQPATLLQSPAKLASKVPSGSTASATPQKACPRNRSEGTSLVSAPPHGLAVGTARAAGSATFPKQDASRPRGPAPNSGLTRSRNTAQQQRSPWRPVSTVPEEIPPTDAAGSGLRHLQPSSAHPAVWRRVGPAAATGLVVPKEGGPICHTVAEGAGGPPRTRRPRDRDLKRITQDMQTLLDNRHQKYEAEVVASVSAGARLLADSTGRRRRSKAGNQPGSATRNN